MNYISILFFAILLHSVTSAYYFRSTKLYLDEIGVKSMAYKDVNGLREKVKKITFEKMKIHEKYLFLNFDAIIDNVKSNVTLLDFKGDGKFVEGKLTMIYEPLFVFKVNFTMNVKIQNILILNGTGTITISGKNLSLAIDYTEVEPISKAKFVTEVTSAEFDSGILTSLMIDFAKRKFTSNITAKLKEIEDDYSKNDPLSALETPQILEYGSLVSINRSYLETVINENNLLRIMSSYITYRDRRESPYYRCEIIRQGNVTNICYCSTMLIWMFGIIKPEETVNMEDWKLKGKVIELYGILPNLINYYQPDANYEVTRKVDHIVADSSRSFYRIDRNYTFKIGNNTLFSVRTAFYFIPIGEVKNKELFVKWGTADIAQTYADRVIQPSGWAIIRRLMEAEVRNTKDKHILTSGIPIEAEDQMNSTDFCFDLITNP